MRKLLIVDDRPQRQERDLGTEALQALQRTPFIELSTTLQDKIGNLQDYTLIAVHRSYLAENELLTTVLEETKNKGIYLVVFSGSISQNVLMDEKWLNINSKDFYNQKSLVPFLCKFPDETLEIKLLQLVYGEELFELPVLMDIRHKFWLNTIEEIQDDDDLFFSIKENSASLGISAGSLEEIKTIVEDRINRTINSR